MIESIDSPYIIAATSNNFKPLVLENSKQGPVLVNFWSEKAGPSLRQYPILDQIVHHYDGRLLLINVDADKEVAITREYGITSIPTLKLFRNQQVVVTLHGYQSEEDLLSVLNSMSLAILILPSLTPSDFTRTAKKRKPMKLSPMQLSTTR